MKEQVILVNSFDEELGFMEKMEAHQKGILHRAFSVLIFHKNRFLLQRRSLHKYHSAGLWTNACCSHPRKNETIEDAAQRRLMEELGIQCEIRFLFSFIYNESLENGLIEHELDHVLIGHYSGDFMLNPEEVMDVKWMPWNDLLTDVEANPKHYTAWLRILLNNHKNKLENELSI